MERRIRGIRILRKEEHNRLSVKLFVVNECLWVVAIRHNFWGLFLKKRTFEFQTYEDADYFFEKVLMKFTLKVGSQASEIELGRSL